MLWWKFAKFLMSFFKPQVSFSSNFASLVSWKITPLYSFSSNIIYLVTRSPLKHKFYRFYSARVKIFQILHVNFKTRSHFLFNFCIIFIVVTHNSSSQNFKLFYFSTLDKKSPSKSQFRHFWVLLLTFAKFLMSFSKPQVSFSSNFASFFNVMKDNSSVAFLAPKIYTLLKRSPLKLKFLRLLIVQVKICQIPNVNFEMKSRFLSKFFIPLQYHEG